MIENNILKFRYGDICVGSDYIRKTITFQQFIPPRECGEFVELDVKFIGEKITLHISYEDYNLLSRLLSDVTTSKSIFEFKGYTFDFQKFTMKSIDSIRKNLLNCMKLYMYAIAC